MKVLAVCGFGVGSSMILRMSIEKVFKDKGIEGDVENTDINDARGRACDAIFTSEELYQELKESCKVPVYRVKRYMDLKEVKEVVEDFLEKR